MAITDWERRNKDSWWNKKKLQLLYIHFLTFDLPTSEAYELKLLKGIGDYETIEYKVSKAQALKSAMIYMRDN
jgi:hypothetical protein